MFGGTGMIGVKGGGGTPATVLRSCLARQPEATFADRLKARRLAAGLTLLDLAEGIGVPHQRVCDYECSRYAPQWRTLVRMVGVLGVGVVDVTG
jgi:DNA-binding XRE family transcriptional regulator